MKLCVFGATGQTGKPFIKNALESKYKLNALVRDQNKLDNQLFDSVKVVQGDILNSDKVEEVIKGCDAVISLIGHTKDSDARMQTKGIENIIQAMKKHKVDRLISLTGAGVSSEGDQPKFIDKAVKFAMGLFAKDILQDGIEHAELIKKTNINWTIVRAPMLNNDDPKGEYVIGKVGDSKLDIKISRNDLARAILDMIDDKSTYGQMPVVAWGK
ncbi:MAG: NAD(P)H-binding protein [Patescibacteria group bacterium]